MKKFYLLSVLFFGLFNGFSQTPITLTFQAKDSLTQSPLALDSVYVQNLTENCDTTLYDAVSVLNFVALWPVGMDDPGSRGSESFTVMQNTPNPFRGSTLVRIHLQNAGDLNLAVYDNQGKQLSEYHNGFEKGWHLFGISTNGANLLFLKVSDNTSSKTIKLISAGSGNEGNRISYQGQDGRGAETLKSVSDRTGFIVYLGNQLQYTAYVDGYQESVLSDNPETSKTYTFAMLHPGFICGSSLPINHVAGAVAPVNKTVTYGTVTNIPGETSKCWITSNLGADHQATAKNDATEPSAGWYWQFNRKQGFKHTGSVRTPNTTWITSIEEDFDWQAANDPCAIELGSGWRLPTYIEWYNVDAGGNWTNWNGPWNSALKMHAAGELGSSDGLLYSRGSIGDYWCSTQAYTIGSFHLRFGNTYSAIQDAYKASAKPLRCLREPNTAALPTVTTAGMTGITPTSANGGGEVTNDGGASVTARGVCWSTLPNPTTADSFTVDGWGTGAFLSNLTDLIPGTPYYVRSYATNFIGTAYGNEVTFTTLPFSFTCGTSITINHVAGAVAPVNKTVTYGTVTNIPGAPSKCWITSNLGADHQATAVSDATEPSAGWYWQFNRKQGYKHTGTVRTPNTQWITLIDENLSWQASNDPCTLELGSGWRIPTNTEWTNVDAAGNWTDWNGPWNSALKMHAAGGLGSSGALGGRGSVGHYWSSTQGGAGTVGYRLSFYNSESLPNPYDKAYGFSLRCLAYASASTIPTVSTSEVVDITQTTATGGGNVTADGGVPVTARGVCWSTLPNPTTADSLTSDGTGTGIFVSNLTGLTPNTPWYVRAYATNSVGTAYGDEVTFTTLPAAFTCGTSITINHVAGVVAPVNKTVTYGTVTNIPGAPSKCWITSNLGADHQATSKSDATEPSAGWYWQFNRKQGYKHTGTVRTPNTTWINWIDEDFDWQAANDPCSLELGAGWRIPTATEWTNVDASGNWTNWNGPWNSALKMHAAGYLISDNGTLSQRGSNGCYWSSTQNNNIAHGWYLQFTSTASNMNTNAKSSGWTIRCLREPSTATLPTVTTAGITGITPSTATGGGEVTGDGGSTVTARGVCWSTSPNPTTVDSYTSDGNGTGAFVSNLIDLIPGTPYYVRSYATNFIGTAYGNEVTFTTLPFSFTCASSITISHVAGAVAPVNKTVTYNIVTNIPGETLKCWIASNLGADHQATAKDDATEASAGWYWQFNRKQGYKHDGVTRTPNTTWIHPINENSNWVAANDPCTIELGSGWRIPTNTEWTNVDASGGWTNWNGPWNSALKMHASGDLDFYDGSLSGRGIHGNYWSSTQWDDGFSLYLLFYNNGSFMTDDFKEMGCSLRCISEASAPEVPTVSTSPVIDITPTTATGGGNVTADGGAPVTARGVCWSALPNPTIADSLTSDGTGTGAFVSNLTGLTPNTPWYVRAYATNSVGTAYGDEVTFTTLPAAFTCGTSLTINHVAGAVAPVNKTVTYGTVTNIPGETSKCWITSNLGADHQATAKNDATEASAGWYWQFNRKQGYKHTGTVRTPNATWITPINENSNWMNANDPCTIELGTGWRIPTYTEWTNVEASGNWTNWNGPWNSALKMHAAGTLDATNGSLSQRGSFGAYWSNTQAGGYEGFAECFSSGLIVVSMELKATGFSLRCLKE